MIAQNATEGGYLMCQSPHSIATNDNNCYLQREVPNSPIFLTYALVVPTLASFGLCANFINAVVFMRLKMIPSAFSYLAALSWLDCISCFLITLTGLSRSIFYNNPVWIAFDYQWQTPLFGITTGAANLILGCVSFDRLMHLSRFAVANRTPAFCKRKVARCMIGVIIMISTIVNMPYFFVFIVNSDGKCQVKNFYYSTYYKVHNWFTFLLLSILPAIFLLVGNIALILIFRRWTKQSRHVANFHITQKRYMHQMKLTITIVIVITLYMLGELPSHMTSRKSALNLIFGGDISKVNVHTLELLEVICITLNALQLSINNVVYVVVNPLFMTEFFKFLRAISDSCLSYCGCNAIRRCCRNCYRRNAVSKDSLTENTNANGVNIIVASNNLSNGSWSADSTPSKIISCVNINNYSVIEKTSCIFTTEASAFIFEYIMPEVADTNLYECTTHSNST